MVISPCLLNIPVQSIDGNVLDLTYFEKNYLKCNCPVVIKNSLISFPCSKWTVDYLLSVVGNNQVMVRGKTNSQFYKIGKEYTIRKSSFAKYVDDLRKRNSSGMSSYLAVQNIDKVFPQLQNECIMPDFIGKIHNGPFLWVGREGHYEYCHYDPDASLIMMIEGSKLVRLFSCSDLEKLYPNPLGSKGKTIQSQVDLDFPNIELHPNLVNATCHYCTLNAGDMLLIPAFWWHQVTSQTDSVSMNVFFGDAGTDSYIVRIMQEPVWPAFRYWLLNVVEQNQNYPSFDRTLERLPVCVENILLKHFHEVAPPSYLDKLVKTIMQHLNLTTLPKFSGGGKHPPPLKIRGLRWR